MDNLGSHKSATLRRIIRAAGARLWYLPPYSPDLNPIDQAFAKVKHWMRIAQKRTIDDVWRHIGTLVHQSMQTSATTTSPTLDTLP
jgi:putative transposase